MWIIKAIDYQRHTGRTKTKNKKRKLCIVCLFKETKTMFIFLK